MGWNFLSACAALCFFSGRCLKGTGQSSSIDCLRGRPFCRCCGILVGGGRLRRECSIEPNTTLRWHLRKLEHASQISMDFASDCLL